jgi:hypothetical protein
MKEGKEGLVRAQLLPWRTKWKELEKYRELRIVNVIENILCGYEMALPF